MIQPMQFRHKYMIFEERSTQVNYFFCRNFFIYKVESNIAYLRWWHTTRWWMFEIFEINVFKIVTKTRENECVERVVWNVMWISEKSQGNKQQHTFLFFLLQPKNCMHECILFEEIQPNLNMFYSAGALLYFKQNKKQIFELNEVTETIEYKRWCDETRWWRTGSKFAKLTKNRWLKWNAKERKIQGNMKKHILFVMLQS